MHNQTVVRQFFLYIKILVSEQGNVICEKIELSQFVGYQERQKGLLKIANILYLFLVVELFFYNHLMITFRAVHHIVFFRFIWK